MTIMQFLLAIDDSISSLINERKSEQGHMHHAPPFLVNIKRKGMQ